MILRRDTRHLGHGGIGRELRQADAEAHTEVQAKQERAEETAERDQDTGELCRHRLPPFAPDYMPSEI